MKTPKRFHGKLIKPINILRFVVKCKEGKFKVFIILIVKCVSYSHFQNS